MGSLSPLEKKKKKGQRVYRYEDHPEKQCFKYAVQRDLPLACTSPRET